MNGRDRFIVKKKAVIAVLIIAFLVFPVDSLAAASPQATGNLDIGAYVRFGSYGGEPILWQVVHNDTNGSVLFSSDILTYKAFDAKGDKTDGRDSIYNTREAEGSNYWPKSNIREWLNSAEATVDYSHQPPDAGHTLDMGSEDCSYADEPGFLSNFVDSDRAIIQQIQHKVMLGSVDLQVKSGGSHLWRPELDNEDAYHQWMTDKVFLLSWMEYQDWVIANRSLIDVTPWYTFKDGSMHNVYWLRTPSGDYAASVVSTAGSNTNAYLALGIRPALYVKPGMSVSGSGTKDNPYIMDSKTGNPAPAQSSSVPSSWAVSEIEAAKGYGLTTERVLSDYQSPITRELFCELAVKLHEVITGQHTQPAPSDTFVDTRNTDILKAYALGIAGGVGEGRFAPEKNLTREQLSVMFHRTMQAAGLDLKPPVSAPPVFADQHDVSAWAVEAVADIGARGIIGGVGGNRFAPQGTATREQAIALVKRVYEYMEAADTIVVEPSASRFSLDTEGPIYLSVNETKRINATIVGDNLSFDEKYPRWGTSDVAILQVSGDVISGYSNTFAGVTERYIVTADQGVVIKALKPGEATLKVSVGPYTDNQAQLKTIKVIVR